MNNNGNQFNIETHNFCNNNCNFCCTQKNTFKLSLEKIQERIHDAKSLGITGIMLVGGEPTLDKDFFEIIDLIKSNGLSPCVTSNGIKLANEEFLIKTISNISELTLSIHSHKQEILYKISKYPHLADKQKQALDNIEKHYKKYKTGIGVNIVINHLNYNNLFDFIEWLHKNYSFIKERNLFRFKLTELVSLDKNIFNYKKIKYNDLMRELNKVYNYLEKNKLNYLIDNFPLCILNKKNYHLNRVTIAKIEGSEWFFNNGDNNLIKSEIDENFKKFNFVYHYGERDILSNCIKCKFISICPGNKNVNFSNNETNTFIKNVKREDYIDLVGKILQTKDTKKILEHIKNIEGNYIKYFQKINNLKYNPSDYINYLKNKDASVSYILKDYIEVKEMQNNGENPILKKIIGKDFFGYYLTKYQKNNEEKTYNFIFSKENKNIEIVIGKNLKNFYKETSYGLYIKYKSDLYLLDVKIIVALLIKLLNKEDVETL